MQRIGDALVGRNVVTAEQLNEALQMQLMRGGHLGTSLIELGYVDEGTFARILADLLGMRCAPREMFKDIPSHVLAAIPREEVVRRQVVPIGLDDKTLHLAVIDRKNVSNLSVTTGYKIILYVAPEALVLEAMEKYYRVPRRLRYLTPSVPRQGVPLSENLAFGSAKPAARPVSAPAAKPAATQVAISAAKPTPKPTPKVAQPVAAPSPESEALRELSRRLSQVLSHAELGEVLLDHALEGCNRRLLFAVSDGEAEVANSRSVDVDPESWNGLRLPIDRESIFSLVAEEPFYRGPIPASYDAASFFGKLSMDAPQEILVVPIYGEDSLEAVLYGDGGTDGRIVSEDDAYTTVQQLSSLAVRMLNLRVQLGSS